MTFPKSSLNFVYYWERPSPCNYKRIKINNFYISNNHPFTLIAGPCVLENKKHTFMMIEKLQNLTKKLSVDFLILAIIRDYIILNYNKCN